MLLKECEIKEKDTWCDELARLNRIRGSIRRMLALEAKIDPARIAEVNFLLKRV